mgnify:CR=1 FL=1
MSGYNEQKAVTQAPADEETFQEWDQTRPTVQELSSLAAKGARPSEALTSYEWLLWYELRDIYSDWWNKAQDEERLKARKQDAVVRYETQKRKEAQHDDAMRRVAALFQNIEEVGIAYRKDRNLDNADRLMNVVYGLLGGE